MGMHVNSDRVLVGNSQHSDAGGSWRGPVKSRCDYALIALGGSQSVAVSEDCPLPLWAVSSTTAIQEPSDRLTHASWRPGIS